MLIGKPTVHTKGIVRNIVSMVRASSMTLLACMTWVAPTIWVTCIACLGTLDYTAISLIDMKRFYDLCCFYDLCSIYDLRMLYDKFRLHIVSSIHDLRKSMSFIFPWIVPHLWPERKYDVLHFQCLSILKNFCSTYTFRNYYDLCSLYDVYKLYKMHSHCILSRL